MESKPKESVVARLFGFGKKSAPEEEKTPSPESGFARTDANEAEDGPEVTIPEQVIRVRTGRRAKDDAINAISDSFRELTGLLGSVSDRLDRQDSRTGDLADQLRELPEYLRSLPQLQQAQNETLGKIGDEMARGNEIVRLTAAEQTEVMRDVAGALRRLPEVTEDQSRAVLTLGERVAEGNEAVHGVADAVVRSTEELRERSHAQEEAIRQVATAQQQTAKVVYSGQQKSLQLFQAATQKTLQTVQRQANQQQEQLEEILDASERNMRRMFWLVAVLMGATVLALAAVLLLR